MALLQSSGCSHRDDARTDAGPPDAESPEDGEFHQDGDDRDRAEMGVNDPSEDTDLSGRDDGAEADPEAEGPDARELPPCQEAIVEEAPCEDLLVVCADDLWVESIYRDCNFGRAELGAIIPDTGGLRRGEHGCEWLAMEEAERPPRWPGFPDDDLEWQRGDPGEPPWNPAPPLEVPAVECQLATGCPEVDWVIQLPPAPPPNSGNAPSVVATDSGVTLVNPGTGVVRTLALDARGEPLWALGAPLEVYPLRGSDEVLVLGGAPVEGLTEAENYFFDWFIGRLDATGQFLWWRRLFRPAQNPEQWFYIAATDEILIQTLWYDHFPGRRGVDDTYYDILVLDATSGEFKRCVQTPSEFAWQFWLQLNGGSAGLAVRGQSLIIVNKEQQLGIQDVVTGETRVVDPRPGELAEQARSGQRNLLRPIWLPDGTTLLRTFYGFHRYDADWSPMAFDPWVEEDDAGYMPPVPLVAEATLAPDLTIQASWIEGLIHYTFPGLPGERHMDVVSAWTVTPVSIAADGVVIHGSRNATVAWLPDYSRWLWRVVHPPYSVTTGPLIFDDGRVVFADSAYRVYSLRTVHGGLARTSAPRQDYDNSGTGNVPEGPYQTENEPRRWLWPEELDGSGE